MNKKISMYCLAFCLAVSSAEVFAQRGRGSKSARSGGATATQKNVNPSIISGFQNKYFKNTSITLVEKRSVEISPLMFENKLPDITKTATADAKYRLCIPCANVVLEYEKDGKILGYNGGGNCYSLEPGAKDLRLTVKDGAIATCGSKLRMTINDARSSSLPEVDSIVLNILPNSSEYDYTNITFSEDKEILTLIKEYDEAKAEAKKACDINSGTLKGIKDLLIASTTTSAVSSATGAADTVVQAVTNINNDNTHDNTGGADIASTILSGVSTAGNLSSTITSSISVTQMEDLIDDLKECKKAATKMHNAGLALEAGLEDITSADNIEKVSADDDVE
ncbi:MAG: hypothetical protein ACI4N3_03135 [Alphaproteobacteria bacterium]